MKDIKGFEGLYAITREGKVWSYRYQKYMTPADNGHGYLQINLWDMYGNLKKKRIHRLVAEAFLPNPDGKTDVNHKDNCRTNNHVDNLEWVSRKENCNQENSRRHESKKRTKIRCVETGEIYDNQAAASRATGIGRYNISNCITGKQKTAGGYHWERIEENVK